MKIESGTSFDQYTILSAIGKGGMGKVYLARDKRLNRKVAIKFLNDEFAQDSDKLGRFIQEARAISALNHPNILTVYEIGKTDGRNYIVTEFIEGTTLSVYLSRQKMIPLRDILKIGIQVAEALVAAHQAGIIHRDIKPENIIIREDGYAKVLDFGLAKLSEKAPPHEISSESETMIPAITIPGVIMGTVSYMSPEQARGREIDARTDVWSLGIVLYEMLAGELPFQGETINHTIVAIMEKEPLLLKNIPDELQRIVRKALTKDIEMRYQSAKDFLIDLKNLRRALDLQGEIERSGNANREAAGDVFQQKSTLIYAEQTNEEIRQETKNQDTPRATLGGRSFYGTAAFALIFVALCALVIWLSFSGEIKQELPASMMKSINLTSWSSGPNELIVEAAFSPDTKMIAFGSARSGATEIWVKPTIGGEPIQVTKNGYHNQYPIWSPNGQELAYFSSRGDRQGIWRASFTGGEQTEITGNISAGTKPRHWAKSGKIYFQNNSDLFAVDETSGETAKITDFESRNLAPRVIEIAPDESKIAFSIKEDELWKIKVRQLDEERLDEIAVSKNQIDYLVWHPNGRSVIFSATVEGVYQIFEASTNGGTPVQLSTGTDDFFAEDVSSDGNRILYWSQNENSDLWSVTVENGQEKLLADSTESEYWGSISPDGKTVAYQSVAKANRPFSGSITVKPVSGEKAASIISASGFSPVWSKSGEWVSFFRRSAKEVEIWCVSPIGGNTRKLVSDGIQVPGYSSTPYLQIGNQLTSAPNSDGVIYTAKTDGKSNLWLATTDGQRNTALTFNEDPAETLCCPAWSPNGKQLVVASVVNSPDTKRPVAYRLWMYGAELFETEKSEKKLLFESKQQIKFLGISHDGKNAVMAIIPDSVVSTPTPDSIDINFISLETGKISQIHTLSKAYSHNIYLSPTGKAIAFVTRRENISEVRVVPVGVGGEARSLVIENDPKVFISSLSWSPDGKFIVFGRQSQNSLLSMLIR